MTRMEAHTEKRQFDRIPENVAIAVKQIAYPPPDESAVSAQGKNISAGGICFTLHQPYTPGDLLHLEINLPGWQRHKHTYAAVLDDALALAPLTALAKVAWCKPRDDHQNYEIGVVFENIYADDHRALRKYLSSGPA